MDDAFLQELDAHISNVGVEEVWEREIAGRKVLFSPVPFTGQAKVTEALNNPDLKANVFAETKRITLAWAIVGIDGMDLRDYRDGREVFPLLDPRLGKKVKVSLSSYVYAKIQTWNAEFIDAAFDVFADLMQTWRRVALQNVKLENLKDPERELAELETRAAELRDQLGLRPMVEADYVPPRQADEDVEPGVPPGPPPPRRAPARRAPEPEKADPAEASFDPFEPVAAPQPPAPVVLQPAPPVPVPVVPRHASAAERAAELAGSDADLPLGTPERPHQAIPSVQSDVIEGPTGVPASGPNSRLLIDKPTQQSLNPRFRLQKP